MKIKYVWIAAALILGACSGRKAPNGLEMEVFREGEGEFAKPGEYLVMNLNYKDSKDSAWYDSRKQETPVVISIADAAAEKDEKGIESCFRALKKGDSVRIKVSAQSLFVDTWKRQLPSNMKPDETITFLIGVKDVIGHDAYNKIQQENQDKQMALMKKQQEAQLATDIVAIDAFLELNKITAVKDQSGLRYAITKKGVGAKPPLTSTVTVNYKGSLMTDGTVFDQSKAPLEYPLTGFIQGWQIGFQLLPKGSKAVFYIPSSLAYGAQGYAPTIPPNANLVFEVELLDFK